MGVRSAQALGPMIDGVDSHNAGFSLGRVLVAAIAGGTASVASGGKFANGALTAAFSRAFNDEFPHDGYSNAELEQIGFELKKEIAAAYLDSDGNLKISKDFKFVEISVDEAGQVSVTGKYGFFSARADVTLDSSGISGSLSRLGIKAYGVKLRLTGMQDYELRWQLSIPFPNQVKKWSLFGWRVKDYKINGSLNLNLTDRARNSGILKDAYDVIHYTPDSHRCKQLENVC